SSSTTTSSSRSSTRWPRTCASTRWRGHPPETPRAGRRRHGRRSALQLDPRQRAVIVGEHALEQAERLARRRRRRGAHRVEREPRSGDERRELLTRRGDGEDVLARASDLHGGILHRSAAARRCRRRLGRASARATVDRALELCLVHRRAAGDVQLPRLVVELLSRPALRARGARPQPAAPRRRDVVRRAARRRARGAGASALLVHGPRCDLLRARQRPALLPFALLDVLVLARELRTLLHSAWGHVIPPRGYGACAGDSRPSAPQTRFPARWRGHRCDVAEMSAAELAAAQRSLSALRAAAAGCRACHLWENATQTVFGEGRRAAEVMMIGEQPGDKEDLAGRPFAGPAGRVLDEALGEVGIERDHVYLTNAVKHFKWKARGKRRIHDKPNAAELAACRPWLDAELAAVKPQVVVLLGATAAQALLGHSFRVTT